MKTDYSKVDAGPIFFAIWHEQWDANIQHHADQGVIIQIRSTEKSGEKTLLQFNCFHVQQTYIYDPDGKPKICQIDPIADGNPIGWSIKQLKTRLPAMLSAAGYKKVAANIDMEKIKTVLRQVEQLARDKFKNSIQLVKHNRGDHIFEAGNIRFGLELRTLGDDGGLAIHVLTDLCGSASHEYSEETEILAFDCFRLQPHYHYGPRNKNLRYYWDKTVVPDPLEWTLDVLKAGKLGDMIRCAGYPDVAKDLDNDLVRDLLPTIELKARELQPIASNSGSFK
ncbi:MAG: hypothetical protein CMM58_05645 [Rhodospirillaceae bacterium]|nr:hypothetical protein [Rhodospirillaceae bacterium]